MTSTTPTPKQIALAAEIEADFQAMIDGRLDPYGGGNMKRTSEKMQKLSALCEATGSSRADLYPEGGAVDKMLKAILHNHNDAPKRDSEIIADLLDIVHGTAATDADNKKFWALIIEYTEPRTAEGFEDFRERLLKLRAIFSRDGKCHFSPIEKLLADVRKCKNWAEWGQMDIARRAEKDARDPGWRERWEQWAKKEFAA